ncbi:hypothetical protein D3C83_274940 [compost metagenome]
MLGHGCNLAVGPAGGDDHEVGDGGFAGHVDDGDILGLVTVESGLDERQQLGGW